MSHNMGQRKDRSDDINDRYVEMMRKRNKQDREFREKFGFYSPKSSEKSSDKTKTEKKDRNDDINDRYVEMMRKREQQNKEFRRKFGF